MINICFHGIGEPQRELEPGEAHYWITADTYHCVIDEIATWGEVAVSFDDGNASDAAIGLDPLVERGLPGSFFVVADRIDQPGSLDTESIRRLRDSGMTVGTHGKAHRPWTGLSDGELHGELVEARERIATAVGAPVDHAALPLGRYDRRVLAALKQHGYRRVYSSDRSPARAGSWFQPRYSVTADDTVETLRERVLRRQGGLDMAKGTLNRVRKGGFA